MFDCANKVSQSVSQTDSEATAQCELLLTAPNRNILTYLLIPLVLLAFEFKRKSIA